MPDVYSTQLLEWDNTSSACNWWVRFADDVFDNPAIVKRIYKVYMTYKSSLSEPVTSMLNIAKDGTGVFDFWMVSGTPVELVDTVNRGVVVFTLTPFQDVQSLQLKLIGTNNNIEIADIHVEYRPIYRRVVSKVGVAYGGSGYEDDVEGEGTTPTPA